MKSIRVASIRKEGQLVNTLVETVPEVSQFRPYTPKASVTGAAKLRVGGLRRSEQGRGAPPTALNATARTAGPRGE